MIDTPWLLLHTGQEVTFGEYLIRVLVYLVAFAAVAGLTYWLSGLVDAGRARFGSAPGNEGER